MSDAKKSFTLYTAPTPNGFCPSILLEEMKAVYPDLSYEVSKIEMSKNQQKEPWFIKLNPNGRIPVLVDHLRDDHTIFETSAIALYLVQNYDKDFHFWFDPAKDTNSYSDMLQWTFFSHGAIGPMTGQLAHFNHHSEDIPYAKKRYLDETKRLYGVFEIQLKDRDWLAGPGRGKFSIADVKTFPWVHIHQRAGIESIDEFPHLKAYVERNRERAAVQAGLKVAQ
ncbi:hypothetical protein AX17_001109 [Amanita inopinata Kibby_2008]|nr:hypothetical protein AX17_001109 [Amanita inopinata Kibby_2008]